MSEYEEDFVPHTRDEQSEQPQDLLPFEDAPLEDALRRHYHLTAEQSARTLMQARERILQSRRIGSTQAQPSGNVSQFNRTKRERISHMQVNNSASGRTSRFSRLFGMAAIAASVGLIIVSMVMIASMLHTNQDTSTATVHHDTPLPTPTNIAVPDVPGIYMVTPQDQSVIEKLDVKTRATIWKYKLDIGGLSGGPVIAKGDSVYVIAGRQENTDSYIYALNANNGTLRWRIGMNKYIGSDELSVLETPTVSDGVFYIMARSGKLLAIDTTRGNVLWQYNSGTQGVVKENGGVVNGQEIVNSTNYDCSQPMASEGIVYGACHNVVFAVNAINGRQIWSQHIDQMQLFNDPQVVDGSIYLTSFEASHHTTGNWMNGTVYAYDAKSGALRWHYPVNNWLLGDPVIVNGTVYFGSYDQNVYALRASDGSRQWRYKTKGQIRDTPVVSDGVLYIDQQGVGVGDNSPTGTPSVLAINASSGQPIWEKPINGTPMAAHAGVLYVLADDGLYGVNTNNGAVLWHIASSLLADIIF